jgi:hypothetical protein
VHSSTTSRRSCGHAALGRPSRLGRLADDLGVRALRWLLAIHRSVIHEWATKRNEHKIRSRPCKRSVHSLVAETGCGPLVGACPVNGNVNNASASICVCYYISGKPMEVARSSSVLARRALGAAPPGSRWVSEPRRDTAVDNRSVPRIRRSRRWPCAPAWVTTSDSL